LNKLNSEAQQEIELLAKLAPGSEDFRSHERRKGELVARFEIERKNAEEEFSRYETRFMASLYKEIQEVTTTVAQAKGLTYVVKISPLPPTSESRDAVMTALARSVVYSDPRADITGEVVRLLNQSYAANSPGSSVKQ